MRLPVSNADLNFECVSQQQILTKLTKCSAQIFRLSGASKVPARGYRKKLDHRVSRTIEVWSKALDLSIGFWSVVAVRGCEGILEVLFC